MAQSGLDLKIAAPGLAVINSLGNLGGFVAPTLFGYLKETTGSTNGGLYTLSAASLVAVIGVYLLRRPAAGTGAGAGHRGPRPGARTDRALTHRPRPGYPSRPGSRSAIAAA